MQSLISKQKAQVNWMRFNSTFVIEVTRGGDVFTSTAVALGKRMLLTAAHCVDCAEEIALIVGEDYRRPDSVKAVHHWVIHPGYNPGKSFYQNDLAIIYLDEDLPHFTALEVIADLPELDQKCFLERIGFGGRDNHNIRTWTNPSYMGTTFDKKNFILKDELSVVGDSGGPVYKEEEGQLKLIGIHSTLEGDNRTYVVNLSCYKDWIEGHLEYKNVV
ncbi:MAG: trypsin-like serine protease [Bacteriovoracaceae bacterium]|nr:trypsin-like serine protease [Bacteriovoracaceae bacterium]